MVCPRSLSVEIPAVLGTAIDMGLHQTGILMSFSCHTNIYSGDWQESYHRYGQVNFADIF